MVPEFVYKNIYDLTKHRFYPVTDHQHIPPRPYQKGIREYLLCRDCEDKLNVWEKYFSKLLLEQIKFTAKSSFVLASGIEYNKFKLFQMSIIWRAGISSMPEFSNISLGPHSEKLREMIFSENPGEPWEYGCFFVFTPNYRNLLDQMMMFGERSRFDKHSCYIFLMLGVTWVFVVSSHSHTIREKNKLFLSKDGVLPMIIESSASGKYFGKQFENIAETKAFKTAMRSISK